MGNNRVFDYTEIARIYGEMNTITGDSSDPTSIAGLLHKINEEFTEVVNGPAGEDELALKGDAASDLKNSWDNTVSDHFTKFVENFGAWSTAVAASAGDYTQFEQAVKGIKSASPLGWNSGGATDTASATGFYSTAMTDQQIADYAALAQFHQLTGATYVDTGMVSYAKKKKIWNTVQTVLAVGGLVSGGISIYSGALTAGVSGLGNANLVGNAFRTAVGYNPLIMATPVMGWIAAHPVATTALSWAMTGAWGLGTAVSFAGPASNIAGWLNPDYDPAKYMTGSLDLPVAVGQVKNINGTDYTFAGSSTSGINIYYDGNNKMVYDDGTGNLLPVTDTTGNQATYVQGANTVISAGNTVIGPQTTLTSTFVPKTFTTDYKAANDELDTASQDITAWMNSSATGSASPNVYGNSSVTMTGPGVTPQQNGSTAPSYQYGPYYGTPTQQNNGSTAPSYQYGPYYTGTTAPAGSTTPQQGSTPSGI